MAERRRGGGIPMSVVAAAIVVSSMAVVVKRSNAEECASPNVTLAIDSSELKAHRSKACAFGELVMRAINGGDSVQIATGNGWWIGPSGNERSACVLNPPVSDGYFATIKPGPDGKPAVTVRSHGGLDGTSTYLAQEVRLGPDGTEYVGDVTQPERQSDGPQPVGLELSGQNCK